MGDGDGCQAIAVVDCCPLTAETSITDRCGASIAKASTNRGVARNRCRILRHLRHFQPEQHFCKRLGMIDHLHMGTCRDVHRSCSGQDRCGGRKDDVVAVAEDAGKAVGDRDRFRSEQFSQPSAGACHLTCVGAESQTCQRGATMRRTQGNHVVHPVGRSRSSMSQPGANNQSTHAVCHHNRRHSRTFPQGNNGGLELSGIVVDIAEHRLEIDADKGDVAFDEPRVPGIPQASVADEAMGQHQTTPRDR